MLIKKIIKIVPILLCLVFLCGCTVTQSSTQEPDTSEAITSYEAVAFDPLTIPMQDTPGSTCFSAIGYDAEQEVLVVQFRESGSKYSYSEFNKTEWETFISAKSLGKYYNSHIKGQFPSTRLSK